MREIEQFLGFLLTQQLEPILATADEVERVSLETFHPSWFVKYCFNLLGHDDALEFLRGSINPPPNYVRINTLIATEEAIVQKLGEEGVKTRKRATAKPHIQSHRSKATPKPACKLQRRVILCSGQSKLLRRPSRRPQNGHSGFRCLRRTRRQNNLHRAANANNGAIY